MNDLDRINATSMERLRFRDFSQPKSGRDEFSRLSLARLRELVSRHDAAIVAESFEIATLQASCLRWRLRGADLDYAIRKVRTDDEISGNAIPARYAA